MYVNDFSGYGSLLSSIKGAVASVVPSHTIVGKWAGGDTAGAAQAAGAAIKGEVDYRKRKAEEERLAAQRLSLQGGGFSLGGMDTTTLLMVGGGLLAVLLLLKRRKA